MKKGKVLALFLCALLSVTALCGCAKQSGGKDNEPEKSEGQAAVTDAPEDGTVLNLNGEGFPIVKDQITMTVFGARDPNHEEWDKVRVLQAYEDKSNIHMDYQEIPNDGFDERKQLLFAGNELPDLFLRANFSKAEITMYGVESQQLIPLEDLIGQYAPNLMKLMEQDPSIRSAITASDGHIYTLPSLDFSATGQMGFKQWINKDWLKAVGMEVPTTVEELKAILYAFRDKDPNGNGEKDEIPLGIRQTSSVYCLGGSFGLEYQMKDTYNLVDGKLHNWLCDDEFKEYLQYLNELYSEKLLWQEYYKDDLPSWRSNLAAAAYGAMYMPYTDVFVNVEDQYIGYDALTGPRGDNIWSDVTNSTNVIGAFAISNTCAYPEAAIRWVDYFYGEEGSLFFRYGMEGETYTLDENGQPKINDNILNAEEGFMTALGKVNLVPGGGFPHVITDATDGIVASQKTKDAAALLKDNFPETVCAKPALSLEDGERVNTIEQDLTTYRDEAVTRFIIGEWSFDKWDDYCNTLEKNGIRELEEIYSNALN